MPTSRNAIPRSRAAPRSRNVCLLEAVSGLGAEAPSPESCERILESLSQIRYMRVLGKVAFHTYSASFFRTLWCGWRLVSRTGLTCLEAKAHMSDIFGNPKPEALIVVRV